MESTRYDNFDVLPNKRFDQNFIILFLMIR